MLPPACRWGGCFYLLETKHPTNRGLGNTGPIPRTTSRGRKLTVANSLSEEITPSQGRSPSLSTRHLGSKFQTTADLCEEKGRRAAGGKEPQQGPLRRELGKYELLLFLAGPLFFFPLYLCMRLEVFAIFIVVKKTTTTHKVYHLNHF